MLPKIVVTVEYIDMVGRSEYVKVVVKEHRIHMEVNASSKFNTQYYAPVRNVNHTIPVSTRHRTLGLSNKGTPKNRDLRGNLWFKHSKMLRNTFIRSR